jgi:hypothetical protein
MPQYKEGSIWSARDAQYVWDGVEKYLGTYGLNAEASTGEIKFGKANGDITPDTASASIIVWDANATPPVATTEQIDNVVFAWLSDETISDGKEVVVWRSDATGQLWTILWAECEDAPPVQVGDPAPIP